MKEDETKSDFKNFMDMTAHGPPINEDAHKKVKG